MAQDRRTALVTGGVQGLDAAAARALSDAGMIVAAGHLGCGERAKAFGSDTGILTFEWDVGDFDACAKGMAEVEDAIGRDAFDRTPGRLGLVQVQRQDPDAARAARLALRLGPIRRDTVMRNSMRKNRELSPALYTH